MRSKRGLFDSIEIGNVEKILRGLVRINSVNPSVPGGAGEKEIAVHIADKLRELGLSVTMQDVVDGRQNVVGRIKGSGRGPSLMLNGHLDTVGVEGMTADPFDPRVDAEGTSTDGERAI